MKKAFSFLSALCFSFMILPLAYPYSLREFNFLEAILDIHIYLPLVLGLTGIVLGFIGIKGQIRLYLVLFNAFGLGLPALIGFYGFKEP